MSWSAAISANSRSPGRGGVGVVVVGVVAVEPGVVEEPAMVVPPGDVTAPVVPAVVPPVVPGVPPCTVVGVPRLSVPIVAPVPPGAVGVPLGWLAMPPVVEVAPPVCVETTRVPVEPGWPTADVPVGAGDDACVVAGRLAQPTSATPRTSTGTKAPRQLWLVIAASLVMSKLLD
jgi:hypothetical protein